MSEDQDRYRDEWVEADAQVFVRPFLATQGRAATVTDLPIETLVQATAWGAASIAALGHERLAIMQACMTATSIAELSAGLRLPLSTVRVIATEMVRERILMSYEAPDEIDYSLVERLRATVAKL